MGILEVFAHFTKKLFDMGQWNSGLQAYCGYYQVCVENGHFAYWHTPPRVSADWLGTWKSGMCLFNLGNVPKFLKMPCIAQ